MSKVFAISVLAFLLTGCGEGGPIAAQERRDERQSDINAAGAAAGCPPGEVYVPGAGSAWYIEPTPGGCFKE